MALIVRDNPDFTWYKLSKVDLGAFDCGYGFYCNDYGFVQDMIDWLAQNCTDNFIVIRRVADIVAGGYTDNQRAWNENQFNLSKMKFGKKQTHRRIGPRWDIKLSKDDHLAFYLRWVDEIND